MVTEVAWDVQLTWNDLSPRQQDIMLALARGLSNQEIADSLNIKLSTVRNNIADVYYKLGILNRVQALLWVLAHDDLATEIIGSI